jgi:glycosyltransferase involved in cell wall biosynthesis
MQGKKVKDASIIMAVYNGERTLERALKALLKQDYRGSYEIIAVDDGSSDRSRAILRRLSGGKLKTLFQEHGGVCRARNLAIKNAKYGIVVNMDQDCIAGKKWLKEMVAGFDSEKTGIVSAYGLYGGTSTAFRKKLLEKAGGYDEEYGYYREDTDLSFRIMELGYKFRLLEADYMHDHRESRPEGVLGLAQYVLRRLKYHQNDVLLYRKHPTAVCREFLHIKYGFIIDPVQDFRAATGTWEKGGQFGLSSPRGITFIENRTPLHTLLIIIAGAGYAVAVKLSRLAASLRFRKLLV